MKYSIITKFVVIILCAASLVSCAAGAGCILLCESNGLYTHDLDGWMEEQAERYGRNVAEAAAALYAAEHLGGCTRDMLIALKDHYPVSSGSGQNWSVSIWQGDTQLQKEAPLEGAWDLSYQLSPIYPVPWKEGGENAEGYLYQDTLLAINEISGEYYTVDVAFHQGPTYQVLVSLHPAALDSFRVGFMTTLYQLRYHAITLLAVALLVFAATLVYLCCSAGRRPNSDGVYPVALNRLPLDLYLAAVVAAETGMCWLVIDMLAACFNHGGNWAVASLIALGVFAMALMVVAFLFAFSAQMKTRGGFWWRRTIIGFLLVKLWRGLCWLGRGIRTFCGMLPMAWQLLGCLLLMALAPIMFVAFMSEAWAGFWEFFWGLCLFVSLIADVFILVWWAWSLNQLLRGITVIRRGGLHHQIPTQRLWGRFRHYANALNSVADGARIAAERQLRSERMKTELITNVSHDIKTPLTSIINYVDLLKKPHDEAQGQQYLEVLDRQSQRLKKLIEDLMDMSKASTGNMAVEMGCMDAVEAVNQALGEFADKLAAAGLEPVFRAPGDPVMIRADGRLLWRVLSNLLGNAVKYAMPGTRLYLDLLVIQGNAILNMKNISRDQLNVDAEELMERFVRGDASRNTEGSGLGLNIARSLVELQRGKMHLMVDGDLFKVTIVLPLYQE